MSNGSEVRESSDGVGGFVLELMIDGCPVARVDATAATLRDMSSIGLGEDDVRRISEAALREQQDMVGVSTPGPTTKDCSRFASVYAVRRGLTVTVGVVWYDTASSVTGPSRAPQEVRQQMRTAVHRLLKPATISEPLANAFLEWHSVLVAQRRKLEGTEIADDAVGAYTDEDGSS